MQCLHPVRLFDTGLKTESGKIAYIYDSTGTEVISPSQANKCGYPISYSLTKFIEVPCGVCVACRHNHAQAWAFRCLAELQVTDGDSYFLTLTYDDAHNPGYVNKKALQDFHKRLRKAFGPFRFYCCAEYGDTTHRPHYHGIYYGLNVPDLEVFASRGDVSLYTSEKLSNLWGLGFVTLGAVTPASCAYVSGYVSKKFEQPGVFQLMSRRPGIGLSWFRSNLQPGELAILPTGSGKALKGAIPRSAFPLSNLKKVDWSLVDREGLANLSKSQVDDFRWAMDYALKHPCSKKNLK